jgi:hypothetical protein
MAVPEIHHARGAGDQQHSRPRVAPYHAAVRFANRSNGAPLATIVEQRSVSTLNSRASLLSVGRFSSVRTADNMSPGRAVHGLTKRLDEKALKGIEEESRQNDDAYSATKMRNSDLQKGRGAKESTHNLAAPTHSVFYSPRGSGAYQAHYEQRPRDSKGLKSLIRDALLNVRGGSRSWSGLSSMTNAYPSQCGGERLDSLRISPQSQSCGGKSENISPVVQALAVSDIARGSHLDLPLPLGGIEAQPRNRMSSGRASGSSAGVCPPMPPFLQPTYDSTSEYGLNPHLSPVPDLSHPGNVMGKTPSIRPVLPAPRDVAPGHVHDGTTTLCPRSRDELSARDALETASVGRNDAPSFREYDHARDMSRNASFCSTMSTSYSGTVLGVDLDLHHDFSQPTRRPVTPVWFTPMESTDSASKMKHQKEGEQLPPDSVTSSALAALLPIAYAEGIVHRNSTTPKISFFSPSGNLFQAENSSPLLTDTTRLDSYCANPSATATSFYGNAQAFTAYDTLSASSGLPPPRPAAIPMTTPPQSYAPLPEHLRHHHNYRHLERSQITPESSNYSVTALSSGLEVRGCGGVIRPDSIVPHSGKPRSSACMKQRSPHQRSMCCLSSGDLTASRTNVPLTSRPSARKGRTLKKCVSPPGSESGIGQTLSLAMRVCFCQPYDGAGQRTAASRCRSRNRCHDETSARQDRDTETPNVRVVLDEARSRSIGLKTRARNDSGVSTGTSIRVGVVGA